MEKSQFRVVPTGNKQWNVFEEGYDKPLSMFDEKDDAVNYAYDMAQTKEEADVSICGADGKVESTKTFHLNS